VLETDGCDLSVEYQISPGVGLAQALPEQIEETGSGVEQAQGGTRGEALHSRERLFQGRRRIEEAPMGDHPYELADAEDWQRPWLSALRQRRQARQGGGVQSGLAAVGVDENIGVYGDQDRPSMSS
jgi:hypothetical protein